MGREIKRVPAGFDWPIGERWWGFVMPCIACMTCGGTGRVGYRSGVWQKPDAAGTFWCPTCGGEKRAAVSVDPPKGEAYQLWETTSEGSPISPAFETPEELARWLANTGASSFGPLTESYETWLAFVRGPGWAPSAVRGGGGGLRSGVRDMADTPGAEGL